MYYLLPIIKKINQHRQILEVCFDTHRLEGWLDSIESPFIASMIRMHLIDLAEEIAPYFNEEKKQHFRAVIDAMAKHGNPLPLLIFLSMYSDNLPLLYRIIKSLRYVNQQFHRLSEGDDKPDIELRRSVSTESLDGNFSLIQLLTVEDELRREDLDREVKLEGLNKANLEGPETQQEDSESQLESPGSQLKETEKQLIDEETKTREQIIIKDMRTYLSELNAIEIPSWPTCYNGLKGRAIHEIDEIPSDSLNMETILDTEEKKGVIREDFLYNQRICRS